MNRFQRKGLDPAIRMIQTGKGIVMIQTSMPAKLKREIVK